jgi:hypothetical protein
MSNFFNEVVQTFIQQLPESEQTGFAAEIYRLTISTFDVDNSQPPPSSVDTYSDSKSQMLSMYTDFLKGQQYYRSFKDLPESEIAILLIKHDFSCSFGKQLKHSQAEKIYQKELDYRKDYEQIVSAFTTEQHVAWYGLVLGGLDLLRAAKKIRDGKVEAS